MRRTLTYTNAGHNAPILFRASINDNVPVERLLTRGTILGMFPETEYPHETIQLASGDVLVLFTDGITEATNEHEGEFGEERVTRIVGQSLRSPAAEMKDRILAELASFTGGTDPRDDMTLVVAKVV